MTMNMSSLDSQLYQRWLHDEAAIESQKNHIDLSSHHRRVQMLVIDTWRQTTEFVAPAREREKNQSTEIHTVAFRLPSAAINRIAERAIQNYWTTRPFNRTPTDKSQQTYPSEISRRSSRSSHRLLRLVSLTTALSWSLIDASAVQQQQKVSPSTDRFSPSNEQIGSS